MISPAGPLGIAEAIGWDPGVTTTLLDELEGAGAIVTDRNARVVYLPELLQAECSRPASPSTAAMWKRELLELDAGVLRERIIADARAVIAALGNAWADAFDAGIDPQKGKPKPKQQAADQTGNQTGDVSRDRPGNQTGDHRARDLAPAPALALDLELSLKNNVAPDGAPAAQPAGSLRPVPDNSRAKPSEPLPYSVSELQAELAAASGGRYVALKLAKGPTMAAQRLIRDYSLAQVRLAGEWLHAGGEGWRDELDGRHLRDLSAWIGHAEEWESKGRPPPSRSNSQRAAPLLPRHTRTGPAEDF